MSSRQPAIFVQIVKHTEERNIHEGKALHAKLIKAAIFPSNPFYSNAIVNLYAKCGHLPESHLAFNQIPNKDIVSWSCIINAYAQQGTASCSAVAVDLFHRMLARSTLPSPRTLVGVFNALSYLRDSLAGRQAHSVAVKTESCRDVFVGSCLVNMYCRSGLVGDARKVFDEMPERNSVSWATMVSGYASERMAREAFEVFRMMMVMGEKEEEERENEFVLSSLLSSLTLPESVAIGRQVHGLAIKDGLVSIASVRNALVTMYSKCWSLHDALQIFEMSEDRSDITWSAMITGLAQGGDSQKAMELFSRMHYLGIKPSEFTFVGVLDACGDVSASAGAGKQLHCLLVKMGYENQVYVVTALVGMYAECGSIDDARRGFDTLHEPDFVLWTSMIGGYVVNGDNEGALSLYGRMEAEGISFPNELTLASVLKACSSLAALEQGKQIHARAIKYGFRLDDRIGSALSTMYTKCGCIEDGYVVFRRMMLTRDLVSWNAMISGLAQNGCSFKALDLFDEMILEGMDPDEVTFVNVLSACSHIGLVERGRDYFNMMSDAFGIVPGVEHYACMVDVLSRAGRLKEAKELIESAKVDHGMSLWRILLSACSRNHRHYELGAYAGEKLMELGSPESSAYVMLSKIYNALGRFDDVERVMKLMKLRGVTKEPGCSWIELKNLVHVFVVGDRKHPLIEEICAKLRSLTREMMMAHGGLIGFLMINK
ncbi:hypothetical protein Dimus_000342 [Dionaea muscipula]